MCERMVRHSELAAIRARFRVRSKAMPAIDAGGEITPGALCPVIRRIKGGREIVSARWGLALDHPLLGEGPHAAIRAGALRRAAALEFLLETGRCIVPIEAFHAGPARQARTGRSWAFALEDETVMGLAALLLPGHGAAPGSFALVTTSPNESVALLADSMPFILFPEDEKTWLAPGTDPYDAFTLIKPYPGELMRAWPVAAPAGKGGRKDGPDLLRRVA